MAASFCERRPNRAACVTAKILSSRLALRNERLTLDLVDFAIWIGACGSRCWMWLKPRCGALICHPLNPDRVMARLLRLNTSTLTVRSTSFTHRGFAGTGFASIRFLSFQSFLGTSRPATLQRISQPLFCRRRLNQLLSRSIRSYPRAAPPKRSAWETLKQKVDNIEPTNFVKGIIAANVAVWLGFQYGHTAQVRTISFCGYVNHRCLEGSSIRPFGMKSI